MPRDIIELRRELAEQALREAAGDDVQAERRLDALIRAHSDRGRINASLQYDARMAALHNIGEGGSNSAWARPTPMPPVAEVPVPPAPYRPVQHQPRRTLAVLAAASEAAEETLAALASKGITPPPRQTRKPKR